MDMEMEKMMGKKEEGAVKARLFVREVSLANVTLAIQFLLGMYINLYVGFPSSGPAEAWSFAWHTWPVAAHIILGTLILLTSISTLVRAIRLKNRHWITFIGLGVSAMLLSVIGILFNVVWVPGGAFGIELGPVHPIAALNFPFERLPKFIKHREPP